MRKYQTGLSLVELMVGMAISLFILGGVAASFISNGQTAAVKRDYDNMQDALRFAATILPRVVHQAADLDESSDTTHLTVRYAGGETVRDCMGQPTEPGAVHEDVIVFENGQLLCNDIALTDGIRQIRFSYGIGDDPSAPLVPDDYVDALAYGEGERVRSIRIHFEMDNGTTLSMTAALRNRVLGVVQG